MDTVDKKLLLASEIERIKEREEKFKDITINHLTNSNQLLLTLGVGFLAFTFEGVGVKPIYINLDGAIDWQAVFSVLYLFLTTSSVALGICVLFTRFYDFRITTQVIKARRRIMKKYNKRLPFTEYNSIKAVDRITAFICIVFLEIEMISKKDIDSYLGSRNTFLAKFN